MVFNTYHHTRTCLDEKIEIDEKNLKIIFSLPISLWATLKRSLRSGFSAKKRQFFHFFLLIHEIIFTHVHRLSICSLDTMATFGSNYPMFRAIWRLIFIPAQNRVTKKACFLSILRISKHPSVARCWLSVDFYLSCHKHTSKLLVALSRVSKSLLDRFLDRKTWFFVFSDFYARCVPKGLKLENYKMHMDCLTKE